MILQPRYHRRELTDLTKNETEFFVKNMQRVDTVLRKYWSAKFPDDPIERIYVTSFSESEGLHLHFHLIPRTRKLGQGNPPEYATWRIFELTNTWKEFPEQYRIRDNGGKWSHANLGKVEALMAYLRAYFWEYSGKDLSSAVRSSLWFAPFQSEIPADFICTLEALEGGRDKKGEKAKIAGKTSVSS
jgi:diadenosine tetraphosphate (Ap4A) HIT family hydrolase